MKTLLKSYLLLPFFALFLFTSCQDEVTEITESNTEEVFTANSELANLMRSTSTKDGSADNIIDKANGITVKFPVTVVVNGEQINVESEEDFETIESVLDAFEEDDDNVEIVFPITVVLSDHTEVVVNNQDELDALVAEFSHDEEEEDDDIECIDFVYPLTFSLFDSTFNIIDTKTVNNDRELYRFINQLEGGVLASLDFPVQMVLSDGTEITVNNNSELKRAMEVAEDECDEDDDNDHNDDDFTKERLDNLLITCPWLVHDIRRNATDLRNDYREYVLVFKEDGTVKVRARNGDMLTGTWTTRVTDRGAKITLDFDTIVDFTLDWFVYEIEHGKIKLFTEGGNRIILVKACDIVVDQTIERIENFLKECLWRVSRLHVDGSDNEVDYIGTPLKFFNDGVVKIRINGEFVQGTWDVLEFNAGFVLQINLEGRPDLQLQWLITFLEPHLIKLENANSIMVLKRHCLEGDEDVTYINNILNEGKWEVALYDDGLIHVQDPTENFNMYTLNFIETGRIKITDPNEGITSGSWIVYRNEGLRLGMKFGDMAPFNELTHRWKIVEVSENRIELKDFSASGEVERILVFERIQ